MSDYRTAMGAEAIVAVANFMTSRRFDGPDDRAQWVEWALEPKTFPFRYEKVVFEHGREASVSFVRLVPFPSVYLTISFCR